MDKARAENSDNFDGFETPKVPKPKKQVVNPLGLPYPESSDSETENVNEEIGNSPRKGRPAGSKNKLTNQYVPRSTKSRRSASQIISTEEPQNTKRITRSYYSSSESESDLIRKRVKRNSNSSTHYDSNESERASDSDQGSTLPIKEVGVAPKKARGKRGVLKKQASVQESPNAPSTSKRAYTKKNAPTTRRPRTSKKPVVQDIVEPTVLLRQNGKGVLIRIDNTEPATNVNLPVKTLQKGVVSNTSESPTNLWDPSQVLEIRHETSSPNSTEISSEPSQQTVLIINNRLFKFDALVPEDVQLLSDDMYIHACGSVSKERLMSFDPNLEFEEISRIPMKISAFISLYGIYFGHKKLVGNNGKKVKRKGLAESNISSCFFIYCRICKKLKACTSGSFNNFIRHLQDAHSIVDPRKMNLGVLSLDEKGAVVHVHSERYKWDNPRQVVGLDLLLQYLMDSNLPFANIEKFSLKRLLNFFDPQFKLPSSKTLHALLSKRVETEVITSLNKTLQSVKSATLIVDAWSSRSMQGVLAVSIIFLDEDFFWRQKTISIARITGSHTAFNIGEKIKAAIKRWNLTDKIRFVVSDGGSNMVKCLADLYEESIREDLGLNGTAESNPEVMERSLNDSVDLSTNAPTTFENQLNPDQHSPCNTDVNSIDSSVQDIIQGLEDTVLIGEASNAQEFQNNYFEGDQYKIATLLHHETDQEKTIELGKLDDFLFAENLKPGKCVAHTLQRVLAEGIKKNAKAKKIHNTIKKIAAFGRKRQVVREITKALLGRVVIRPGLTRWNSVVDSGWTLVEPSMFSIMQSLIADAHVKTTEKMRSRLPEPLTDTFALELKEFLMVSDPICKLTDELQGNGITAHLVIPGIARAYEAIRMTDVEFMEEYREVILRSFEEKMAQFVKDKDFIFATVLCPYYKYHFFEIYFEEHPCNALNVPSLDTVKELCYTHLQTADEMVESFTSQRSQPSSTLSTNCSYAQKIQEREKQRLESIDRKKSDLEKYIGSTVSGDSPMEYWQRKKLDFPKLYDKAREIFCKPATSGLVERLFSLIADINTPDRVNLHVKTLEEIIFYKEFINIPRTYKEATSDIFNATDAQLAELVDKLSVQSTMKKNKNNSSPGEKETKVKRSARNAPSMSVADD